MAWVTARRISPGRWKFTNAGDAAPAGCTKLEFDEFQAETQMNAIAVSAAGAIADPFWRLEFAKHAGGELSGTIAGAKAMAEALKGDGTSCMAAETRKPAAFLHAAEFFRAEAAGKNRFDATAFLRFLAAIPAAVAAVGISILRNGGLRNGGLRNGGLRNGGKTGDPAAARAVIALHGELANRTRHVLPLLSEPDGTGNVPAVCIVGRPRGKAGTIANLFKNEIGEPGPVFFYPFGMAAFLFSLPSIFGRLWNGALVAARSPVYLTFRDCAALSYRVALGTVSARWWRGSGLRPEIAVFGHTGVADTMLLEAEMQRYGARTVHCVHGASLGINFAARSDLGLFVCGHDARLAREFPGYDRTAHLPAEKPGFVSGDPKRWLLLTAYSHPMNPAYAYCGIGPDIEAIRRVSKLAEQVADTPDEIVWRPHPAIAHLSPEHRAMLEKAAREAGFNPWPDDLAYKEMAEFGRIFTTPSTAALDALKLGKVAELVVIVPLVPETFYGRWPPEAVLGEDVEASVARNRPEPEVLFGQIWDGVGPGRFPGTIAEIEALFD